MSLFGELKKRNVLRVGAAYIVTAWLIIQVVETLFPIYGLSGAAVRWVVNILGIGLVPALALTWVFEWTPGGLIKEKLADHERPDSLKAAKRLDRMILALLALALAYFAIDKFVLAPERAAKREAEVVAETRAEAVAGFYGDHSIAVIPFENLSSDPEQQYLGDGVAEEVLNLLARIRELRVISRSSAFALRDEDLDIPEIAARLNVAYILEGSVRKAGNRVRVTTQLIEARSDTHLWSHTYERELDDIFRIQDEIAADVVTNLQIVLLGSMPKSRHADPEVLALTAQAYQLVQARPEGVGEKMYTLLSRALEIDPDYIPALDLMAAAYWFLADLTWEEMQRKIAATYERILELDPDSAYPDFYHAFMLSGGNRLEESAVLYSIALEKDLTNPSYVRFAGYFALNIGKLDAATRLLKYALAIDPLCHQCRRRYAESLMFAGDYANAQWEYERYLAGANEGWDDYTIVLLLQGMASKALAHIDSIDVGKNEWDDHTARGIRAMTLYSLGDFAGADRAFEELIAMQVADQRSLTFSVTRTAAWMGKNDLAFENLFAMAATQFQYLQKRTFSPSWRNLHDDPRWLEYREFNGMSAERLDVIEFNPDLPE